MRLIIQLDNGEEIEVLDQLEDWDISKPVAAACLQGETLEAVARAQARQKSLEVPL